MKRLISAALALTLLGATAASAQPYDRGGGHHRGHGGNGAVILGLVLGLFALGAIASSSQRDRHYDDRYYDSYGYGPPPPPPPPPRYRQWYGYDGYGYRY